MKEVQDEIVDPISESFYGRIESVISWLRKDQSYGENYKTEKFNSVILNIQDEKDIYRAWDGEFNSQIADYENEPGQKVLAQKTDWIETLPDVMVL